MKEAEYTYLLAFMNISRAISSSLELQEVLNRIVQSTCETTGSKGCTLSETLRGKPVIIEDATSDPRVQYPLEAKQEGIASIVSLSIILRERVIGVLRLYTSAPCRFTQDDIDFLSAIAVQSGLAIENAKMHEHVKMDYKKMMLSPSSMGE